MCDAPDAPSDPAYGRQRLQPRRSRRVRSSDFDRLRQRISHLDSGRSSSLGATWASACTPWAMNLSRYSLFTVTVRLERFHPALPLLRTNSTFTRECQSNRWNAFVIVEPRLGSPAATNA